MKGMRSSSFKDVFGALLLIGALFAFGLFNFKSDEPLIEAGLRAQAAAISAQSRHGITITVEGRAITAQGLVDSEDEKSTLIAALRAMDGRGRLRHSFETVPPMAPFMLDVTRTGDGLHWSGGVPTEAMRAGLRRDFGEGVAALTLASGAPDAAWGDAVHAGVRALAELETGHLRIAAREITLAGKALTPDEARRAALLLADLPDGYAARQDVSVRDDGSPLRLIASRRDGAKGTLSAKLPDEMAGLLTGENIALSPLAPPFPEWADAVLKGLEALNALQSGHLTIIGSRLNLSGESWSTAADETARAALAAIPDRMQVSSDLLLADSGAPFGLIVTRDETGAARASGKVPRSLAPPVLSALLGQEVAAGDLDVARISPSETWWQAATLGVQALRGAMRGEMRFDGHTLGISALLADPPAEEALRRRLQALPDGITSALDLRLIDDGTPLRLTLVLRAGAARASGKWPDTLTPARLARHLDQPVTLTEATALPKPEAASWTEAALTGTRALAVFTEGTLTLTGEALHLEGILMRPDQETELQTILADLPAGITVTTDLQFRDDGRPFAFRLVFDGAHAILSGKTPSDLGPVSQSAIMGVPVVAEGLDLAQVAADVDWWIAARGSLKALALLQSGTLAMDAQQITLSGVASDDPTRAAVAAALAPYAKSFRLTVMTTLP